MQLFGVVLIMSYFHVYTTVKLKLTINERNNLSGSVKLLYQSNIVKNHSLSNKQLFNFSENRRPEVVFIGVNYVTFVSGYDPSANLSVVLL